MVEWLTLVLAALAAGGFLYRVYQNERLYGWHRKTHKKRKKKR